MPTIEKAIADKRAQIESLKAELETLEKAQSLLGTSSNGRRRGRKRPGRPKGSKNLPKKTSAKKAGKKSAGRKKKAMQKQESGAES